MRGCLRISQILKVKNPFIASAKHVKEFLSHHAFDDNYHQRPVLGPMHTVEFLPKAAVLKSPPLHLPSICILTVTSFQAELLMASALLLSEVTAVQRPTRDGERVKMLLGVFPAAVPAASPRCVRFLTKRERFHKARETATAAAAAGAC